MKMHHEFAIESYDYYVNNFDNPDFLYIKNWCLEPEIMNFIASNCDEKTVSICQTIKGMSGYQHPTDKQKAALAAAALNGRTARDILLSVYGDKVAPLLAALDEIDEEDAVAVELKKAGIKLSNERLAFGMLGEWIAKTTDISSGNTYRASVRVISAYQTDNEEEIRNVETALIADEKIVLTRGEMRRLGKDDQDVLHFQAEPMELQTYIDRFYAGRSVDFAAAMRTTPQKVSEWKKLGWIVYDGKLWSSRRVLTKEQDVLEYTLPEQ